MSQALGGKGKCPASISFEKKLHLPLEMLEKDVEKGEMQRGREATPPDENPKVSKRLLIPFATCLEPSSNEEKQTKQTTCHGKPPPVRRREVTNHCPTSPSL